jgi:molybdopterin-guanine dinucleotide biosynthesis protein A
MVPRERITAIVLCGGSGERLGAADKTLLPLGGRPLIVHAIDGLRPQVGELVLSCGRDPASYEGLGSPVATDEVPDTGPLGGIVSALPLVHSEWILTYPGDAPFPDPDLVERLAIAAEPSGLAVPLAGGYRQPLVLLLRRDRADEIAGFYVRGGRSLRAWLEAADVAVVEMDDVAASFLNVNTQEDLARAERQLSRRR